MSFTGNSNSLAQLVDNEIPLAQMDIPAYTHQTATQARQYRHRHHKQRQISNGGTVSYENQLATASSEDELDDPDVVVLGSPEVVAAVSAIASNKAREMRNRSGSYSNLFDADFEAALVNSALADGHVRAEGATSSGTPSAGAAYWQLPSAAKRRTCTAMCPKRLMPPCMCTPTSSTNGSSSSAGSRPTMCSPPPCSAMISTWMIRLVPRVMSKGNPLAMEQSR